jgi:hypothetical protein
LAAKKTKPNGRKNNRATTVCTKFRGPRKGVKKKKKKKKRPVLRRKRERNRKKTKSDSFTQHSETGSKPLYSGVNEDYTEVPFTRARFWWSPKWLAYRKTPSNIG